ncbi:MAG: mandelate racemase/muconate lactonizing enzyme family protein [Candidatus Omnitrophota bacterium]
MKPNNCFSRRSLLKSLSAGGLLAAALSPFVIEEEIAFASQDINRASRPSGLKITDMRIAWIKDAPMRCPIIRIDTNQDIYGLGEVRDGASEKYALFLKSRLLGENPCNVEKIFKKIKQFGHHGRQGGGVSAVEMALWDLAGKAYGVPVYQLLGGKYRDKIRIYCDTAMSTDPKVFAQRMKERVERGFTYLKMDLGINLLRGIPGVVTQPSGAQYDNITPHPFTGIEITHKGVDLLAGFVEEVRNAIGYEIPLAADHFGHIGVNSCIRLGKELEPFQIAWLEDMVPWQYPDLLKKITDAIDVPTLTGEDIYLKEDFIKLIDVGAVDMIHPDLATAGGILETKKIGDYAEEKGVPMAMHFAGTPVSCMANVHCAAATQNFLALENHSVDIPWWDDLVTGPAKPIIQNGFIPVPETPGLGVELNEEVMKEHLLTPGYFEPTPEWDRIRSHDRLWS